MNFLLIALLSLLSAGAITIGGSEIKHAFDNSGRGSLMDRIETRISNSGPGSANSDREFELRGRNSGEIEVHRSGDDSSELEVRGRSSENELRGRESEFELRGRENENELRGREFENELRGPESEGLEVESHNGVIFLKPHGGSDDSSSQSSFGSFDDSSSGGSSSGGGSGSGGGGSSDD